MDEVEEGKEKGDTEKEMVPSETEEEKENQNREVLCFFCFFFITDSLTSPKRTKC